MSVSYKSIAHDGLWANNAGLVQLLGLCPLLAVSTSFVNGLGLGMATTLVLVGSNAGISLVRKFLRPEIRIPVFVLVIASLVTSVEMVMNAYFHDLYRVLGIFIPLIVTNCAIIGRAEAFASKNPVLPSMVDGLMTGVGFALVLVTLGSIREIIGQGTLFAEAQMLFGEGAQRMTITFLENYKGFLLVVLPPGAFFGLGALIALKNLLHARRDKRAALPPEFAHPVSTGTQ